jgi:putative ABC transport system substrate-binding protein
MRRRKFITLIGGAVASWPLAARAQEAGRTYRLGVLFPAPREEETAIAAFSDELRRRGFIEDQNLAIEYRAWAPHLDLISDYMTELLKNAQRSRQRKQSQSSQSQTIWSARDL